MEKIRETIIYYIEKVLLPEYGPFDYEVTKTEEHGNYLGPPGYVIEYTNFDMKKKELLVKENFMFFSALGWSAIFYDVGDLFYIVGGTYDKKFG